MRGFVVNVKQYYSRGSTWFNYLFQVGIITANAKLFEVFFKAWFGWDVMQTISFGILGYILVATIVGAVDLRHGIWRQENDWVWNATPAAKKLSESVARIEAAVCPVEEGKE